MYEHLLEESVKAAKPAPKSEPGSAALGTTLRARVVIPDPAMVIKTGIETETETGTETETEMGRETEMATAMEMEMATNSFALTTHRKARWWRAPTSSSATTAPSM